MDYFNHVLHPKFNFLLNAVRDLVGAGDASGTAEVLAYNEVAISLPGFHIFPPHETSKYFFGKRHQDKQWEIFDKLPGFPFMGCKKEDFSHFSFTYVLKLPSSGGGLRLYDGSPDFKYEENALYVHSGQFDHAIAETPGPILPCDWRITYQGHGFKINGKTYLYW